ncbi:DNA cytosine methyltransferase [Burkholderia gladioli]|uniref:DNA cytosine methyltransferase n=1 Tax=Burkholderia gladioli TaxID=28095 RepID=UPI001641AF8E|nr:DNA cytosine methyltransferase [Burkholderia gladioli]
MSAYYNEIDPYAAQWLRNLIAAGHIAPGDVDERSIEDVRPDDLRGYTQCHFFAGIGVWSHALRRAGWPDDRPVWTGSCPCQPFSAAGKGAGFDDERHLWPSWFHLIGECRPAVVFGEQSSAASEWVSLVRSDLEGMDYAVGAIPIEAASAGALNLRDRYWFVAHAGGSGLAQRTCNGGVLRAMARSSERENASDVASDLFSFFNGPDGKRRPIESGILPLVDGASSRVGRLRAYGNAINAEAARAFIETCIELI